MAKKAKKKDKPESGLTIKLTTKSDGKKDKKAKKAKGEHKGFEKLASLADHPVVADVLAAGALAAVAAFAESGLTSKKADPEAKKSSKAVKDAGKAAAAAIGLRLMSEFSDALKKNQAQKGQAQKDQAK